MEAELPAGPELDALVETHVFGREVLGIVPCATSPDGDELVIIHRARKPAGIPRPVVLGRYGCSDHNECHGSYPVLGHNWKCLEIVPDYSDDIAAAWQVVAHLRSIGWIVRVQEMPDGVPFVAGAGLRPEENQPLRVRAACMLYPTPQARDGVQICALGETPALAICRAALKTVQPPPVPVDVTEVEAARLAMDAADQRFRDEPIAENGVAWEASVDQYVRTMRAYLETRRPR